jgi:heme exporter protein A
MSTPAPYAVETASLVKTFGSFKALRGLDLEVAPGETLAVFGPNGAGKTTLLKILGGVMRPSGGRVLLGGEELKDNTTALRRRIGLVAHQSYLYGGLSAEENLAFYARMYGLPQPAQRMQALLKRVGLTSRRHDRVGTFSRGMQQRLALARALLHQPALLLLDEPDTGLDPQALADLWGIIRRDEEKRTVVFTSHSFARALGACDRVAVLVRGKLAYSQQSSTLTLPGLEAAYRACTEVTT